MTTPPAAVLAATADLLAAHPDHYGVKGALLVAARKPGDITAAAAAFASVAGCSLAEFYSLHGNAPTVARLREVAKEISA